MRASHRLPSGRALLRSLLRRDELERELDDELRDHVESKTQLYIAKGLSPEDARRFALRDFGGVELSKEQVRDTRRIRPVQDFAQDLRYALRALRKAPGFTATAVLTLALGIGANAAIFSVINAVLLRSLPYWDSDRLFTVTTNQSLPDLEDMQKRTTAFSAIGGVNRQSLDFTDAGEPLQITGALCNAEFFEALGLQPLLGRAFTREEDQYGGPPLVLLTHGFWTRHFGANPAVIGRTITLSGISYTVIGVMPPEFWLAGPRPDVVLSLRVGNPHAARFRGVHFLKTFFRLRPNATIAGAAAELAATDNWLASTYPEYDRDFHRRLIPIREAIVGNVRLELLVLFAAVGFVLLIACVNFAGLQLARSAVRRREIAIREALGAPVGRLLLQMIAESLVLALLGGTAGLLLSRFGVRLLLFFKASDLPRIETTSLDFTVVLFTLGVSIFAGVLFGLMPALAAAFRGSGVNFAREQRGATAGGPGYRFRNVLVSAEIALTLVLLIGATLLVRSFSLLQDVNPGFRPEQLLTMRLELPEVRYGELYKQRDFHDQLLDRLNAQPTLRAAFISELPLSGEYLTHNFVIAGRGNPPAGAEPEVQTRTVAGDYFRIMGIPVLSGRDFGPQDHDGTRHVATVNRAFVEQYFPSQNPIGAQVEWARSDPPDWMTIVGVVGDVKHFGLQEPEQPAVYDLYSQTQQQWKRWMCLVIRSDSAPGTVLASAKEQLWSIDPQLPVTDVSTMTDVLSTSLDHQRFTLTLVGVFAGVALALAIVGVYGVISYSVNQRTGEIGIRVALGAQPRDIFGLILGQGLRLAVAGSIVGVLASFALTRYLSHFLFGVSPHDLETFLLIPMVLYGVALLACYVPARRAMRADPLAALRYE
jgi:putative ABC transport system permease protein